MKGEYFVDEKTRDLSSNTRTNTSMFGGKLQQQQQQNPQNFHQLHQPNFHNPFQVSSRECQTSEEADSSERKDTLNPQPVSAVVAAAAPAVANDGATIEVVRRPRGRPPGSKNKPKPPVIITREAEPSMSPYILELAAGVDIVSSINKFCRKRNMGLCILNGSGSVTNVTLRQPSTTPASTVTFHGRFDILSISATIVQPNTPTPTPTNGFTISLAGPQGQVVGGGVIGPLMTAGTVYLIAATFNSPSFHRLPANDNDNNDQQQSSPPQPQQQHDDTDQQSCGMSMYSCQLPSDVIWAPAAAAGRQPPPPY